MVGYYCVHHYDNYWHEILTSYESISFKSKVPFEYLAYLLSLISIFTIYARSIITDIELMSKLMLFFISIIFMIAVLIYLGKKLNL